MPCVNAERKLGPSIERIAGADLSGHRAVAIIGNRAIYASNLVAAHAHTSHGITTGAALLGELACIQIDGPISEPSWNWTPDLPIFIGADGVLTQIVPVSPALFSKILGFAMSPTEMLIAQEPAIYLE